MRCFFGDFVSIAVQMLQWLEESRSRVRRRPLLLVQLFRLRLNCCSRRDALCRRGRSAPYLLSVVKDTLLCLHTTDRHRCQQCRASHSPHLTGDRGSYSNCSTLALQAPVKDSSSLPPVNLNLTSCCLLQTPTEDSAALGIGIACAPWPFRTKDRH